LEELNQVLQIEVVDKNAEMMKGYHRVYTSLMNINTRLEEEIIKLNSDLTIQFNKNNKLEQEIKKLSAITTETDDNN
jgi:hypothetical protein